MSDTQNVLTPVGRLVMGSLYKGQTTDAEGKPLLIKNGPNAGQPRVDWFFALAIPKGSETHWNQTPWGQIIWTTGQRAYPQGQANSPAFAWKIVDGDSTVPNKAGKRPCDREGYPGHWALSFSSGYAPKIFNANGTAPIIEPDAVKLGYYVQVAGTVAGNGSTQQPGVFLNHNMVALSGFGPEIVVGPDPTSVGFGQAPLPAGASATPLGGMAAPPAAPVPTGATAYPVSAPQATVQPHPGFLAPPVPGVTPVPPAPPARVLLPKAQGASYDQLIAAGWTDALLVQHGMMAP